jgi:hypothetical protein
MSTFCIPKVECVNFYSLIGMNESYVVFHSNYKNGSVFVVVSGNLFLVQFLSVYSWRKQNVSLSIFEVPCGTVLYYIKLNVFLFYSVCCRNKTKYFCFNPRSSKIFFLPCSGCRWDKENLLELPAASTWRTEGSPWNIVGPSWSSRVL